MSYARNLIHAFVVLGIDRVRVLREGSLDPAALDDPDGRLPEGRAGSAGVTGDAAVVSYVGFGYLAPIPGFFDASRAGATYPDRAPGGVRRRSCRHFYQPRHDR